VFEHAAVPRVRRWPLRVHLLAASSATGRSGAPLNLRTVATRWIRRAATHATDITRPLQVSLHHAIHVGVSYLMSLNLRQQVKIYKCKYIFILYLYMYSCSNLLTQFPKLHGLTFFVFNCL